MKGRALAASITLLALAGCSGTRETATAPVQEAPTTYLAAKGTKTTRYMDGDVRDEAARYVLEKRGDEVTDVLLYSDNGTHWNAYSCKPDHTFAFLYSVTPDNKKDTKYAGVETDRFCHIYLDSDGQVAGIARTSNKQERNPQEAIKNCPEGEQCELYKVNTKWTPTQSIDLVLSDDEEQAVDRVKAVVDASERQESVDRQWAEGEVEDLKAACRMGQKHWTLCPDGYDKK